MKPTTQKSRIKEGVTNEELLWMGERVGDGLIEEESVQRTYRGRHNRGAEGTTNEEN